MNCYILAIDPGLKHTCVCLMTPTFEEDYEIKWKLLWSVTGDLSGEINPCPETTLRFLDKVRERLGDINPVVVIEYQPPLNTARNPALVRWNAWIEGCLTGYWLGQGYSVDYSYPNPVKMYFDIRTGSYYHNKQEALRKAREYVSVRSDHEADCVLMAIYWWEKRRECLS